MAAVLAFSHKDISIETVFGVAREYYGDKSHGSHVTSYCVLKYRKCYSFSWKKNFIALSYTGGFVIERNAEKPKLAAICSTEITGKGRRQNGWGEI
jgi:hypothetical protein